MLCYVTLRYMCYIIQRYKMMCAWLFLFFIFLSHSLSSRLSLIHLSFLFISLNFPFSLSLHFLRTVGQTVYSLCVGEPDYQPPAEVITATVRTYVRIHACRHTHTHTHTHSQRHVYILVYLSLHQPPLLHLFEFLRAL